MSIKLVIVNLDSALLKIDVSDVESKLKSVLGVEGNLRDLLREAISRPLDQQQRSLVLKIIEDFEEETAEKAEVDQRDLEALCTLRAIGVRLALVTMRGRRSTEKALDRTGLKSLFDVVVTRDEEPERALQIVKACESTNCWILETLYVGFSEAEAIIGVQTGCMVATPYRVLQAPGQTIRVKSLHELLDVLTFTA